MLLSYLMKLKNKHLFTFASRFLFLVWVLVAQGRAEVDHPAQDQGQYQKAIEALHNLSPETIKLAAAPFCFGYTCKEIESIEIPQAEWAQATRLLNDKPVSAKMERALLVETVSYIEVLVGRITHTQYDIGGTFRAKKLPQVNSVQLDCVDETFNMYVYLSLLNNQGKLYWHRVGEVVHRGWLLDLLYPHTALSIVELGTTDQYVIDPWFHDNGRPPELVSLQNWLQGWTPDNFR